jgi:hypothetical protein
MEAKMDLVPIFKWMFQQCQTEEDMRTILRAVNAIYEREDQLGLCRIDGCEAKAVGKGLCFKHYQRVRRHGDPSVVRKPGPSKLEIAN